MRARSAVLAVVLVLGAVVTLPAVAVAEVPQHSVALSGAQEVPGPGDGNGRGEFSWSVDGTTLCYLLSAKRIGTTAAAHIHRGEGRGGRGPVVVELDRAEQGQCRLPHHLLDLATALKDPPAPVLRQRAQRAAPHRRDPRPAALLAGHSPGAGELARPRVVRGAGGGRLASLGVWTTASTATRRTGRPTSSSATAAPPTCGRSCRATPTGCGGSTTGCPTRPSTTGSSPSTASSPTATSRSSPSSTTTTAPR